MIRKTIYSLIPMATALFLLASCGGEEVPGMEAPLQADSPQEIRFEMAYATPAVAADTGSPGTRVSISTDHQHTNTWTAGDEVGVYIVQGDAGLKSSGNYADNVKMTYNGSYWEGAPLLFPSGSTTASFYAYYPYQKDVDPLNITFSANADQSTNALFGKSILMTAVRKNVARVDDSSVPVLVQLLFSHKMAMVELGVESGDFGAKMSELVTVTLEGCRPQVSVDLSTETVHSTGDAQSIKMCRIEQPGDAAYSREYSYRAMVPAQAVAKNTEFFVFSQGKPELGCRLSYKPKAQETLTAGNVSRYFISLNPQIDAGHRYAVGDIYPHKGFPVGVVFEIENSGRSGKIVRLNGSGAGLAWGPSGFATHAQNDENGRGNMNQINTNYTITDYPAFAWVHNLNPAGTTYADLNARGIWYLPSLNELLKVREIWNGGPAASEGVPGAREAFNAKLIDAGGEALGLELKTSTEDSGTDTVFLVYFFDAAVISYLVVKTSYTWSRVRPIMAF
ncbi:MAG: hypothetical protein PARBA_00727 [Parabacteroides sp.]